MTTLDAARASGRRLTTLLGLAAPPVAVAFPDAPPAGIPRAAAAPAGCGYWPKAAESGAFYTEAADHMSCPIGAHTHAVELPPATAKELEGLIGTMVDLQYIRLEEVAQIPRRRTPLKVAVYAPLEATPVEPAVVMVRGTARQIMLLTEAATLAGVGPDGTVMGRPTCAAIPASEASGRAAVSLGCIGNRVYTRLADGELYASLPGASLGAVVDRLETIVKANDELERFHRGRLS
ncbi:MAG TPA: DUF169 domain-containing protein [Thermodesulfobacteriota bacterium]